MAINYDGYSVEATADVTFRYVEGQKHVDFIFDFNSDVQSPIVVFTRPTSCSEGITPEEVARALERICAHLESVGYKVTLFDN